MTDSNAKAVAAKAFGAEPATSEGVVNRDQFSVLYKRHAQQVYAFIRAMVPQQADAEDAFQDVSAVLWQKFGQYQEGTNFLAWATQIAKFRVLNLRDYQHRSKFVLNNDFIETVTSDAWPMVELLDAQHRALADCYRRLSEQERRLVDQRYRDGLTVKDLAERMNRPLRTVYRVFERIHIALLDCVQRKLTEEGVA